MNTTFVSPLSHQARTRCVQSLNARQPCLLIQSASEFGTEVASISRASRWRNVVSSQFCFLGKEASTTAHSAIFKPRAKIWVTSFLELQMLKHWVQWRQR